MDRLDSGNVTRRQLLAIAAATVGAMSLAPAAGAAGAIAPKVAPGLRPDAVGGSASVCALCGREDHSMLGGACLPRRLRG